LPRSAGEEEEDGDDGAEDAVAPSTPAPAAAQQDGTPAAAGTLRPPLNQFYLKNEFEKHQLKTKINC
jgi:hypothetical protein